MIKLGKFLLVSFFVSIHVYAKEPSYTLLDKIYQQNEPILLSFKNVQCAKDLRMSLSSDAGVLEIFDEPLNRWNSNFGLDWIDFPYSVNALKLRFNTISSQKVNLQLKLQNVRTGAVVTVDPLELWISDFQEDYVKSLNQNILSL